MSYDPPCGSGGQVTSMPVPHDWYELGEAIDSAREAEATGASRDTVGGQTFGNCSKQILTVLRSFFPKKSWVNHDEIEPLRS